MGGVIVLELNVHELVARLLGSKCQLALHGQLTALQVAAVEPWIDLFGALCVTVDDIFLVTGDTTLFSVGTRLLVLSGLLASLGRCGLGGLSRIRLGQLVLSIDWAGRAGKRHDGSNCGSEQGRNRRHKSLLNV